MFIYFFVFLGASKLSSLEHGQNLVLFPLIFASQNVFNLGLTNYHLKYLAKKLANNVHLSMLLVMISVYLALASATVVLFKVCEVQLPVYLGVLTVSCSFLSSLINHFTNFYLYQSDKTPYFLFQAVWKIIVLAVIFYERVTIVQIYSVMLSLLIVNAGILLLVMRKSFSPIDQFKVAEIVKNSGLRDGVFLWFNGLMSVFVLFYNRLFAIGAGGDAVDFNTLLLMPGVFLLFYTIFYKLYVPKLYSWLNSYDFKEWDLPIKGSSFLVVFSILGYGLVLVFLNLFNLEPGHYEIYALLILAMYMFYYMYAIFNDLIIHKDSGRYLLFMNMSYFVITLLFRDLGFDLFGNQYLLLHFLIINSLGIMMIAFRARHLFHRQLRKNLVASYFQVLIVLIVCYNRLYICYPLLVIILAINWKDMRCFVKDLTR